MSNQGYDPNSPQGAPQPQGQDPYGQPASAGSAGYPGADQYGQPAQDPYANPQYGQDPYAAYGQSAAYGAGYGAPVARPSFGFVPAIKTMIKNYALFTGRASQSEFWWPVLAYWLVSVVLGGIGQTGEVGSAINTLMSAITGIIGLALLLPMIGLAIRRLHDTDKSGWFLLVGLIPLVGWIILIVFLAAGSNPAGARFDAPDGSQPAIEQ